MKAVLKHVALRGAELSGATRLVAGSAWRRRRVLILCYHGVSVRDEHQYNPELYVSPSHLRRRFEQLRAMGATILPLAEALQRTAAGSLPDRAVVLTFDDGAANFASQAVPLLREFGYPATVYVTSYYVTHQYPVWNIAARYLAWQARARPLPERDALNNLLDPAPLPASFSRADLIAAFLGHWAHASTLEKDQAVAQLARVLGVPDEPMRTARLCHLMTPEEVAALPAPLVSVELHTHRHIQPESYDGFAGEVRENQRLLAEMTGRMPLQYCYPSGVVHPAFPHYLRELGIESATTCEPGLTGAATDRMLAPRLIDTMLTPDSTFRGWVSGTAALLSR
jgi:peptidoglycan/xylan/chitin deacetylase (PgdA/CDA1 family)